MENSHWYCLTKALFVIHNIYTSGSPSLCIWIQSPCQQPILYIAVRTIPLIVTLTVTLLQRKIFSGWIGPNALDYHLRSFPVWPYFIMVMAGSLLTFRNPALYECWLIQHLLGNCRNYIPISKLFPFAILFSLYSRPFSTLSLNDNPAHLIFLYKVAPNPLSQMNLSHSDCRALFLLMWHFQVSNSKNSISITLFSLY